MTEIDHDPRGFKNGELAYDILQNTPVIVTDVTTPRVGDLPEDTQDAVLDAHGNQLLDVDEDSSTVEVAFPGLKSTARTGYTYPTERLIVPGLSNVTDGLTAAQLAQKQLLDDIVAEAARTDSVQRMYGLALSAGVDSEILERVFDPRTRGVEE